MTSAFKLHYPDRFSQASNFNLSQIPYPWPLVPVVGKRPSQKDWVNREFDRSEILTRLESGKATGIGVKLGNGLLAIDFDGLSAAKKLAELAGDNSLDIFSKTTSWTSGRTGRKQCLFLVPETSWHRLRNLPIPTGVIGDDGKEERLEFHWLGRQSVLPPSLHPVTNQPYIWLNNPVENPPLPAPEWLLEVCENWHSEYVSAEELDLVRVPVRLLHYFSRQQLRVWLLARRFDLSRRSPGGKPKGCGIGKFSLTAAARILNRSPGHIRKSLCAAKNSGLIRNYQQAGDWITVFYSSLERAIAIAGIDKLGPIAAISIDDLVNIHIIATEVEAQHLQRASFHRQRQEEMRQIKAEGSDLQRPTQLIAPITLHTCEKLARVLGRSDRFMFCESGFHFYGGSQEAIANSRGLSTATVSRHLANSYRLAATPIRNFRQELPPILKKQLVERLPHIKNMPPKLCAEDGLFMMFGEWWKPHCNVYAINHRLVSARRRRGRIQAAIDKRNLLVESDSRGDLDNKFLLSNSSFPEKEKKGRAKKTQLKNQDKENQK